MIQKLLAPPHLSIKESQYSMKLLFLSFISCFLAILLYNIVTTSQVKNILTRIRVTPHLSKSTATNLFGLNISPPASFSTFTPANMTSPRAIQKAFLAVEQSEGVGARVRRSIGTPQLRNFSPFLMLDHFSVSPGAGFPYHFHC